jgi:hypothetical protein
MRGRKVEPETGRVGRPIRIVGICVMTDVRVRARKRPPNLCWLGSRPD